VLADAGGAGEEEQVEGQRREVGGELGAALHERDVIGGEALADDVGDEGADARHELRGLEEHPVARREGVDERGAEELEWVVPGADDADDPEGLRDDLGAARLEEPAHGAGGGAHPVGEVLAGVLDGLKRDEELGDEGLVAGAVPEVFGDGPHDVFLAAEHHVGEALEVAHALVVGARRSVARGAMHRLEERAQLGRGGL